MARVEKTVFLSYRRSDFPWALAIYKHLTHSGFDVFFDYMGLASGDFEGVILENIRARAHFLVLLTPSALNRCTDPSDWLRREIEESIECRRNIVPLFVEGFDFGNPLVAPQLIGNLATLKRYNGIGVPAEYFEAAMEKLCGKYLNVPLDAVLHAPSSIAKAIAHEQQTAVSMDVLTGLLNRREFENRIERALNNARSHGTPYVVCWIELDQLKLVNEKCGRVAEDALLTKIGESLNARMHARDALARLGGGEFGVLFENCALNEGVAAAEALRAKICDAQFAWDGRSFQLSASLGVTLISAHSGDSERVLYAANSACQAAKEGGRNRVRSFAENDLELARRRRDMEWAARLNNALADDGFELFRQAILPLNPRVGAERYQVLLRMRDESGKLIVPSEFMPAAERYGIVQSIDRWLIKNLSDWLASQGPLHETRAVWSVNLSGSSIGDDEFVLFLKSHLQRIDASQICLEVSETDAVANFSRTHHFIESLKDVGCTFALDNFGTGLSSFGYLKHFPVDFLKIDGSFVREITRDPIDREMVRSYTKSRPCLESKPSRCLPTLPTSSANYESLASTMPRGTASHRPRESHEGHERDRPLSRRFR